MSKTITIKLTKTGPNSGPFTITDAYGNVIASGVTLEQVSTGISFIVESYEIQNKSVAIQVSLLKSLRGS